jgi:hypothetical protein
MKRIAGALVILIGVRAVPNLTGTLDPPYWGVTAFRQPGVDPRELRLNEAKHWNRRTARVLRESVPGGSTTGGRLWRPRPTRRIS